jgi:hypothetical protein
LAAGQQTSVMAGLDCISKPAQLPLGGLEHRERGPSLNFIQFKPVLPRQGMARASLLRRGALLRESHKGPAQPAAL